MDFGKVGNPDDIDFSMPPDDLITEEMFVKYKTDQQSPFKLYVGCTSWGRKDWIGKVYPKGTKDKELLAHYVKQFNCIELNALFYNLQPKAVIEKWAALADPSFRFCPKFPNTISHIQQLRNVTAETDRFIDHMQSFGDKLGPCFLQLSDHFAPNRAGLLQDYLRSLPRDFQVALELRHENWFSGMAASDTWRLLLDLGVGTVITDTSGRRDVLHMRLTTPMTFIRFVANNMHASDFIRIDAWAERLKSWMAKGLREAYFIVHSHDEFFAPDLVNYAIEQFNKTTAAAIKPPRFVKQSEGENLTLF